jgi:hypothetical protein
MAQGLHSMGLARYKRGDMLGYVKYAKRAAQTTPDGFTLFLLAFVLGEVGKTDEARRYADEGITVDPLLPHTQFARAGVDIFDGHFEAASTRLRMVVETMAPDEPVMCWWAAQAAAYEGNEDEAYTRFGEVVKLDAGFVSNSSEVFRLALEGDRPGMHRVIDHTDLREIAETDEYFPCFLANAFARVGDDQEALLWLVKAISWGFTNYQFLSQHNRFLTPLRGNDEFQRLMESARQKQEAFEI